jgi:two-component system, chemotaxis family, CheB/CheR fusion protein
VSDGSSLGPEPGPDSLSQADDHDAELEELLCFIRDARGFDFTGYKRASILRRVRRRANDLGFESLSGYRDVLEADVDEFTALFNTILINLTGFFRDPAAWRYLEHEILPEIISRHDDDDEPIRLWSAGCATGEEPYTLAMILAHQLGVDETARRVKIYATDIDLDALTQARAAVYSEKSVHDVPEEFRATYFEPDIHGRGWVVTPTLRRTVVFGRLDLTKDPPISRVDLVTCRNTLMYLNSETQGFVIPRLHYALGQDGFLFLGRAEMVLRGGADRFAAVSLRHRIFTALPTTQQTPRPAPSEPVRRRPFGLDVLELPLEEGLPMPPEAVPVESVVAELLVDPGGLLTGANDAARELFGIAPDDLSRPLGDVRLAFEPLELESHVRRALVERVSHRVGGAHYQAPGGNALELEIWVLPLFAKDEIVLGAAVTFADVRSTMQLRESYRHVHEELETAYEELQSTNEELVTSNEELQSSYEELETGNEELQSSNEELETTNEELRSSNDELESTYLELKSTSDAVERLNETLVDANLELRRFGSLHRQVMDHFPSAVVVLNAQLLVEEWNLAAAELWGLEEEDVVGEPFFGLDFGLPLGALQEPVRACRSAGALPSSLEVLSTDRSGQSFTCCVRVMPISGHEPETSAMLVMDKVGDTTT